MDRHGNIIGFFLSFVTIIRGYVKGIKIYFLSTKIKKI